MNWTPPSGLKIGEFVQLQLFGPSFLEVVCCLGRNYPAKGREQVGNGRTRSNKLRPEISSEVPPRARAQAWLTAAMV